MTKGQFNRAVKAMLASVISLPDELWTSGFPTVSVRCGNKEAFIGLRPVTRGNHDNHIEEGDDED